MPATTSPDSLVYPVPSDPIAPLNTVFQDLAESVQDALDNARTIIEETTVRTADYTIALADSGKVVPMNKTGAATLTVPLNATVEFPVGAVLYVYNMSSSDLTVAAAGGVELRNGGDIVQYGQVTLRKRATNEWVLVA
jgi:hypothetical protein